jgi:hypothetical protein
LVNIDAFTGTFVDASRDCRSRADDRNKIRLWAKNSTNPFKKPIKKVFLPDFRRAGSG